MTTNISESAPFDGPLGGLPPADRRLLRYAPLEVAIIEVKFTSPAKEIAADVAAHIRDALNTATEVDYTSIQPATTGTVQVNFEIQGSSWAEQNHGWQISSSDGSRSVTLFPDSLIVQTTEYSHWSVSIRTPLSVLLQELASTIKPSLIHRIGLRYVDRFVDPDCKTVSDWGGKIEASLLGPVGNSIFGTMVQGAQQQIELAVDNRHGAILRHGPAQDASTKSINYLLDLDVFAHATTPFGVDDVLGTANNLNRTSLSLFQACVSSDYFTTLQGEENRL